MFENERFPQANAMGVTWQEFWGMNPHIIKCIEKGYNERIKQEDYLQYLWWGSYGISALKTTLEHLIAGNKAKSKYIEKPILFEETLKENRYIESQEEVAVFEMKQRTKMLEKSGLMQSPM